MKNINNNEHLVNTGIVLHKLRCMYCLVISYVVMCAEVEVSADYETMLMCLLELRIACKYIKCISD